MPGWRRKSVRQPTSQRSQAGDPNPVGPRNGGRNSLSTHSVRWARPSQSLSRIRRKVGLLTPGLEVPSLLIEPRRRNAGKASTMAEGGVGASWNARSQRRGRPGFSPGSLFTLPAGSGVGHLVPVNGDGMVAGSLCARQPVDQKWCVGTCETVSIGFFDRIPRFLKIGRAVSRFITMIPENPSSERGRGTMDREPAGQETACGARS